MNSCFRHLALRLVFLACGWWLAGSNWNAALFGQGYTPDHPVVRGMIDQGVQALTSGGMERVDIGYEMLAAYTVLKATDDHAHPMVQAILPKALQFARKIGQNKATDEKLLYQIAIGAMLLSAMDAQKHRLEIENLRDFLLSVQRESGAFNYLHGIFSKNEGDVSQSQYVALALWSIKQTRIEVDNEAMERLTRWFMKVQQNDGGWSYQYPPDQNFPPSHSMAAAGLSGTLVSADCLGLVRVPGSKLSSDAEEEDEEAGLVPGAFRRVTDINRTVDSGQLRLSRKDLEKTVAGGIRWLDRHPYQRVPTTWHYYWMYSRERFESFVELFVGKREKSPAWYNEGVTMLQKTQSRNGAWGQEDIDPSGPVASTCFAVLYLLRNTQKAIGELKTADSIGGYGLANVADVGFIDGKLVDKSQVTSVEDAIKLLETSSQGSTEDRLLADRLVLDNDPQKKKEQLNRFARMLRSPDTRARRIAAKILGRGDELDFAPDLIFALSEGEKDSQVLRLAENSLRILSRQLDTAKLPLEGPITTAQRVEAERYWKGWYLSIRPDHVFIGE
jgi:hypothetical protein